MTSDEFLQEIYDHFRETGEWPLVRDLQVRHFDSHIRSFAQQIGTDRVACNYGSDGRCFLQLREIPNRSGSEKDLKNFLGAMRIIARFTIANGPGQIALKEIAKELTLNEVETKRLAAMLYVADRVWRSAGGVGNDFYIQPDERVIWFKEVQSIEDYFAIHRRVDEAEAAGREAERRNSALIFHPSPADSQQTRKRSSRSRKIRKIFLSHASDDRDAAEYVRNRLIEAIPQSEVFLASRPGDIAVGSDWLQTIKQELTASDAYMVLLTHASVQRPWVQFETGAAWMSDRRLVTVVAAPLDKHDVPMPLSSFQLYSLSESEEAEYVFKALGGHLSDSAGFAARIRELMGSATESSNAAAGWMGVKLGDRFFAWDGPTIHELEDRPGLPEAPGLIEALRAAQMVPTFGLRAKMNQHRAEGQLPVYETDRKHWRRAILYSGDGDQVLLVHPDASNLGTSS